MLLSQYNWEESTYKQVSYSEHDLIKIDKKIEIKID